MMSNEILIPNYNIKKLHLTQGNGLIRAIKDPLSISESKLLRFVVAQVMRGDRELYTYSIKVSELAEAMEITGNYLYDTFRDIAEGIMKKSIYIEDGTVDQDGNKNYTIMSWLSSYGYEDGVITIALNPEMKQFLLDLRDFTDCYMSDVILLPTDNSVKFYELISSWKRKPYIHSPEYESFGIKLKQNEIIYGVDYLRKYFNCEDVYPQTADFIKWIIEYNTKIMNEKLFFPVKYRTIKKGRKIVAVVFTIGSQDTK